MWVNGLLNALSLLIVLYLVRKDENSAYKVGWIALIGILPLLGGALYLAFGNKRPAKRLRLKMQAVEDAHKKDLAAGAGRTGRSGCPRAGAEPICGKVRPLSGMAEHSVRSILPAAKPCIRSCWPIWKKAEKSIFLEFFIVSHGCMWNGVERSCAARLRRAWMCA